MKSEFRKCVAAALLVSLSAGAAMAHAHLESASPAEKSTVAAPAGIDLVFSEGINLKFSKVTVSGPANVAVKLGEARLADGDKTLGISVLQKLAPGDYTVEWHVLSADGHKSKGKFTFTVKP